MSVLARSVAVVALSVFRKRRGNARPRQPQVSGNPGFAEMPFLAYTGRR
ncbi:MAG TPA: hypothetical protein VH333_06725 [Pseudonocardiaceae bacterium]|jgi:hypothetical protein|nr:hypothetical protein [Pseudonocardiaceae bacterium]